MYGYPEYIIPINQIEVDIRVNIGIYLNTSTYITQYRRLYLYQKNICPKNSQFAGQNKSDNQVNTQKSKNMFYT